MDVFTLYGLNVIYSLSVLALVAIGLAAVFGLLGVMNMAHGEFVMLGGYSAVLASQWSLPWPAGLLLAVFVSAMVGALIERGIIKHLYQRPFDTLLATWGIAMLIRKGVEALFGREYQNVPQYIPGTLDVIGVDYPAYRLVLIVLITVLVGALYIWFRKSPASLKIRAMVDNPSLAQAMGINTQRLASYTFIFGVSTAGLAGALIAPLVRVDPYMGLDYLLSSFFALVIGGLGSVEGVILGSGMIGGLNQTLSNVFDNVVGYTGVLLLSIFFLWWKPNGIISQR
ncbi:ABC transporter permease [Enterovibrio norvegicus]|uniref:Branched-chain amino acid ABC transporter permease n=1 Tax=Enterovibrio norvegicus TaxID=188144 RepID=A0ABV4L667_9GAMM|nr:branched-chain amino acid ABC transporter permease [Enterovibrio norvegicus]MCC4796752.1 branched-chain amino acid ABC transporter permease [Enterovibrio norvegicus]OEF55595.1 ABC transporter permease [Enterovibrio norvegicus]PMH62681.1 ABC transporter permease [Enterovibrio norvegicus]PMI34594.1 ABC transporter permease [Enterovibrio norvegicus]PMI37337.1 ABC transporter permease [Enterovibrio norvegicus]